MVKNNKKLLIGVGLLLSSILLIPYQIKAISDSGRILDANQDDVSGGTFFQMDETTSDTGTTIVLKPGLNIFSTPAVAKSIYFSNGGNNISFATMEKGRWEPIVVDDNVESTLKPFYGYIIRNNNSEDVVMTVTYGRIVNYKKNLDTGWNLLGIITTDNPFDGLVVTGGATILDLTNGGDTNKIGEFVEVTKFMLGKAYAVFVNNSGMYFDVRKCDINGDSEIDVKDESAFEGNCISQSGLSINSSNYRCDFNGDGVIDSLDQTALKDCKEVYGKEIDDGDDGDGPTCTITQSSIEPTSGNIILTIISEGSIQAIRWNDSDWSTVPDDRVKIVEENGTYTGYVTNVNGTGSCGITVNNIDKTGPAISFESNSGSNVTGIIVNIYDTNGIKSESVIKYKLQTGFTCSTNSSSYTELSIKTLDDKSGYVSIPTRGLYGEYYLCILDSTSFDNLGNGNNAEKSGKFIFDENNDGFECQEFCENDDSNCPKVCRAGILTDNSKDDVPMVINDSSKKTVYRGNFIAKKLITLNSINLYGNSIIPEGDILSFYVYINGRRVLEFELTGNNNEDEINVQYNLTNMQLATGISIPLEIKAKISGVNKGVHYNYKFKLLGANTQFYEVNPQKISITVAGDDESGDDISNENFMEAYNWARDKGILSSQIINDTNLTKKIGDIELITFIADYAKNILNREIDETKDCSFVINIENLSGADKSSVLEACQLGLVQSGDSMSLNNSRSNMSMLATLLSRSLRNDKYNGGDPYYQEHLNALKIAGIITGTNNPEKDQLKGDVLIALMNSEGKNEYWRVANSYDLLMNDFNAVEDVYHSINSGDRVIFVVRHSARIRNCTSEGGLTEYGVELARGVGEKLQGAPFEDTSTDFYGSSTVKRTVQTSYYVGKNRGSEALQDVLDDDNWNNYGYVNHSSDINSVVYGEYFKDVALNYRDDVRHLYENNKDIMGKRAMYAINTLCSITKTHPFSWITSHDWFSLPITERATNENLSFSTSNVNGQDWDRPNFMQGVAIIVHEDGGWEIYPVKSLESGIMRYGDNPGCS